MARLLLLVLTGASAFFTPPKGVIPSADDPTPDRMVYAFGVSLALGSAAALATEVLSQASLDASPADLAHARDEGLLKLIFRRDTKQILGVHMIGVAASELIHIGMMLLHTGATVDHILNAVFNYPTLSETYRIAALDGVNRL